MHGFGERYVGALVIKGGAGLLALAFLSVLPSIAGAWVQCFSANVTDIFKRRKRIMVGGAIAQALTWAPAALALYFSPDTAYWVILASFSLYLAIQNFVTPPWASVMGDLVPADQRGRYFGLRNFLTGSGIIVSFLAGGFWLDHCRTNNTSALGLAGEAYGFFALFAMAGVARLVSAYYLNTMHEPAYEPQPADRFSLIEFLKRVPKGHFGRFVIYISFVHLGVGVGGAYFGWYVLGVLAYDSRDFAILFTIPLVTMFCSQPLWGRLADRVGNKRLIVIGGIGVGLIPVLWLFSKDFTYLCVAQAYDGLVWAAFEIACWNYLFDVVTPPKRARCLAYKTLLQSIGSGLGIFLGAGVGLLFAIPIDTPKGPAMQPSFPAILCVSAALRLLPSLLLLRTFKEVRIPSGRQSLPEGVSPGKPVQSAP